MSISIKIAEGADMSKALAGLALDSLMGAVTSEMNNPAPRGEVSAIHRIA